MNKNAYFLLLIIALLISAVGFIFYDFNSNSRSNYNNITFRKENVTINRGVSSSNISYDFDNFDSNQIRISRKIKVKNSHLKIG